MLREFSFIKWVKPVYNMDLSYLNWLFIFKKMHDLYAIPKKKEKEIENKYLRY